MIRTSARTPRVPAASSAAGCQAETRGPAALRCERTDPHVRGHVWIGHDVPDGKHDDAA